MWDSTYCLMAVTAQSSIGSHLSYECCVLCNKNMLRGLRIWFISQHSVGSFYMRGFVQVKDFIQKLRDKLCGLYPFCPFFNTKQSQMILTVMVLKVFTLSPQFPQLTLKLIQGVAELGDMVGSTFCKSSYISMFYFLIVGVSHIYKHTLYGFYLPCSQITAASFFLQ